MKLKFAVYRCGELTELKKQNPEIENTMMKRWIQHLREAEDMMLELGAKKASERLASFLIRWCENSNGGWLPLPLSRGGNRRIVGFDHRNREPFSVRLEASGLS